MRYSVLCLMLFLTGITYANNTDEVIDPFVYVTIDDDGYNLHVMNLNTGDDLYMIESSDYVCPQQLFNGEEPYLLYSEGIGSPNEHQFRRLDLLTGEIIALPQLMKQKLSDDGRYLAFQTSNNQLAVLDMTINETIFLEDLADIRRMQWLDDVLYILAYRADDIHLYHLQDNMLALAYQIDIPENERAINVQLAPSGDYLIFETAKPLRDETRDWIVNLQTSEKSRLPSYSYATWHPDSTHLALFTEDHHINIYDIERGEMVIVNDSHGRSGFYGHQRLGTLQWSPDGNHLLYSLLVEGGTYSRYYETFTYNVSDDTSRSIGQYARADVYSARWLSNVEIMITFADATAETLEQANMIDLIQYNIITLERTRYFVDSAAFNCAYG